jgi:serine phosphatase RsbU (regulator of sigma subunit)
MQTRSRIESLQDLISFKQINLMEPLPLGATSYATYQNHTTKFSANDALLLYSDALTETPDASGECISPEAIEACLKNKNHALAFSESPRGKPVVSHSSTTLP